VGSVTIFDLRRNRGEGRGGEDLIREGRREKTSTQRDGILIELLGSMVLTTTRPGGC
jgi:hypothetical protein